MVSLGWTRGHQFVPRGAGHGTAGQLVGEDVVPLPPDPVLLQYVELRIQVLGGVVCLADPGTAEGYGDRGADHVVWNELYLVVPKARIE